MDGSALTHNATLADGIYFDLSFEDYLSEPRFSFHLGKSLLISSLTAWAEYIDPGRRDEDTHARKMGRALHCRLLEGEAVFKEQFAIKPENDGDYLEGGDELRARCGELGLPKSGTIAAMCERILAKDPEAKLWPLVIADWRAANEGKTILSPEQWRETEIRARIVPMHPELVNAFKGGHPEVSILWTDEETGIPCKSRLDLLKVKSVVELKTFSNPAELPIGKAIARALIGRRYHMQGRMELEAVRHAKKFVHSDAVLGDVDPEWLTAFAEHPEHQLVWVFVQQGRVPEIRVRRFERYIRGAADGATENLHWTHGWDCYRQALAEYRDCLAHYGPDPSAPWIAPEPMRAFQDEEFGAYSFE